MTTRKPIAIEDVKRLDVHPGDTIVLRLDRDATSEELHLLQLSLRAALGDEVHAIVLDRSVSMEVVRPARAGA